MQLKLRDYIALELANIQRGVFIPTSDLIAQVAPELSNARSRVWTELRKLLKEGRVVKKEMKVPTELRPRKRKNYKGNIPKEYKTVTGWALTTKVTNEVIEEIHKTSQQSKSTTTSRESGVSAIQN